MRALYAVVLALFISGCATKLTFVPDKFGVPIPHVNGKAHPMTEEERRAIANAFLDFYCI